MPRPRRLPLLAAGVVVALAVVTLTAHAPASPGRAALAGRTGAPTAALGTTGTDTPSPADPAATIGAPATLDPSSPPTPVPSTAPGPLAGGLLIADRFNGRLLIVDHAGHILWHFPVAGSLPPGQGFAADDAFVAPDGKSIVANEEARQLIVRIDIATRRIVWEYGGYYLTGSAPGRLDTPDDAYPLANGDITVADINNCRIIEIAPDKRIVRQWGRTGVCRHDPPYTYASPNGDTPLPDGGMLITEIGGSHVVRLDRNGKVVFDIHVPAVYPSDAHLDAQGNIILADFASPGAVLKVSPTGRLLWRYRPTSGPGMLDHPSLAVPLADGTVLVNDDQRDRVVIIDPRTNRIIWQYGHTDRRSTAPGYLWIPDGVDVLPQGTQL